MSKKWYDPTDYWNTKLFKSLSYRDNEGTPIVKAYTKNIPERYIPANIKAGKAKNACSYCGYSKTITHTTPQHKNNRNGFAHFYLDDYQFERFWNYPLRYIKYLHTFDGAIAPDFSVYSDYPLALQKFNQYRNRALAAYWQSCGIDVIPSVSWSDFESLQWCFKAIQSHSVLSLSTVGILRTNDFKKILVTGFGEMIRVLQPTHIIVYGRYPKELDNFNMPITRIKAFYEKFEDVDRDIHI